VLSVVLVIGADEQIWMDKFHDVSAHVGLLLLEQLVLVAHRCMRRF
jgi:hypothetical protein